MALHAGEGHLWRWVGAGQPYSGWLGWVDGREARRRYKQRRATRGVANERAPHGTEDATHANEAEDRMLRRRGELSSHGPVALNILRHGEFDDHQSSKCGDPARRGPRSMWLPPWLMLAFIFSVSTYVQDVGDILQLSFSALVGRQDTGCEACHRVTALLLKVIELDEAGDIDCKRLCFRSNACSNMCEKITNAMATSERYPCVAAGICPAEDENESDMICRFDWRMMRCTPSSSCQRRFPARCVVSDGLRSWRRYSFFIGRHAGLVASALQNQPRCGERDAGPYCVREPSGLGQACELLSFVLPFLYGTLASVRAVETPGGDDDRQWLTFWVCFFAFMGLERFTNVVFSWVSCYYELKLAVLCWLMFRHGADTIYRTLRRLLSRSAQLVPSASRRLSELKTVGALTLVYAIGAEAAFDRNRQPPRSECPRSTLPSL